MKRRSIPFLAVLLAGALAGCGGSSAGSSGPSLSAFKSGFSADKTQFRRLGVDIGAAVRTARAKTDSELATEFAALASRTTQQAAQLRRLTPPSKYKSEIGRLSSGFDAVATDLRTISGAATSHDATAARAAVAMLVRDAATVKALDVAVSAELGLPQTG